MDADRSLICWRDVINRYEVSHQQLVEHCENGLPVYDEYGNRIYATSQCKAKSIEPPYITWGRILFPQGDNLVFDENVIDNDLFYFKAFPNTGDFVVVRKDVPLKLHEHHIYALLLDIEFPRNISADFFKNLLGYGDETYLPSEDLQESQYYPSTVKSIDIQKFVDGSVDEIEITVADDTAGDIEFEIPYTLKKGNISQKKDKIVLKFLENRNTDLLRGDSRYRNDGIASIIQHSVRDYPSNYSDSSNENRYWLLLQDKVMEAISQDMRPLQVFINGEWFFAPRLERLYEAFSAFEPFPEEYKDYKTAFNRAYLYAGFYSHLAELFRAPERTFAKEEFYNFHPITSPISEENLFFNAGEADRIQWQFFFYSDELKKFEIGIVVIGIEQTKIKLSEFFTALKSNQKTETKKKYFDAAIMKLIDGLVHEEIYDRLNLQFHAKANPKHSRISVYLKKAEGICKEQYPSFPSFPKEKKGWDEFRSSPETYFKKVTAFFERTMD